MGDSCDTFCELHGDVLCNGQTPAQQAHFCFLMQWTYDMLQGAVAPLGASDPDDPGCPEVVIPEADSCECSCDGFKVKPC
jgi:hypothetical protein